MPKKKISEMGPRQLQGVGKFDLKEQLQKFDSIEHISILEALDIQSRLDELRLLKDGWLEGHGQALSDQGLDWLSQAFENKYPNELPLPYLYPTETGGVQAEWSLGPNEVTLEIDLEAYTCQWHALNIDTDSEESRSLNLADGEDWQWLVGRIQQMAGGAA